MMKRNPDSIRKWKENCRNRAIAKQVAHGLVNRSKPIPTIGVRGKRLAKADAAARKECHSRSECQLAGFDPMPCSGPVEDHHVLGRGLSSEAVRVMPENHLRACKAHHQLVHRKRAAYRVWVNATFDGLYDHLKALSNHIVLVQARGEDICAGNLEVQCPDYKSNATPSEASSSEYLEGPI